MKILGILGRRAIKHKLISLYLQTKTFYKSARIAKILNEQQWRLGVTGEWQVREEADRGGLCVQQG